MARFSLFVVLGLFVALASTMTISQGRGDGFDGDDASTRDLGTKTSRFLFLNRPGAPTVGKKRPVLKENSFGYRHAMHMSKKYYGDGDRESDQPQLDRKQQSFGETHHTDARGCFRGKIDCRPHMKYRAADGRCNNLKRPIWGQSNQPYKRLLPRKRSLVDCGNAALSTLPNARVASRLLIGRSESDRSVQLSMYVMLWGQLIDHDLMLTELRSTEEEEFLDCCDTENFDAPDCCPIKVPRGDFFFGQGERPDCIPFIRSKTTSFNGTSCGGRLLPDVQNSNTPWIDLSIIYASTEESALEMRSKEGGKLKHSVDKKGNVFPFIAVEEEFSMLFGDPRSDVTPAFTMIHTSFLRHHNLLAERLSKMHPSWSDEKVFQESRKINIAVAQHITYTEFIDALLGLPNDLRISHRELHRDYYRRSVDPRISMVFQTAAFRLHTLVHGHFDMRDTEYRVRDTLRLRDIFHKPLLLLANDTYDELCRGLAGQSVSDFNNKLSIEMTEWLFAEENEDFGLDIVSLNIQRGRDHQIQGYASYKEFCGLGSVSDWDDFEDLISHKNVHRLLHTYMKPHDVDMFIGANMETPVQGSMLGPTMHCYVREQFENLRDGDRFFYTRPSQFSSRQLAAIKRMTLAKVLCVTANNPATMRLPRNVFIKAHKLMNPPAQCSQLQELDLRPWA